MLNIVNVISDTNIGGAGRMLLSYLRNADRQGFSHTVILPEGSLLADEIKALGINCRAVRGMADSSFGPRAVRGLAKLFSEIKPDIVHTHAAMSARLAARIYGKCRVVHTRHSVFDQAAWKKRFPAKNILGAVNNGLSDKIIAVSPAAKENIAETGANPDKIEVIFNGVDRAVSFSGEERAAAREGYCLNPEDFVLAMVSRLEPVKGHETALNALKILSGFQDIKLLIAGTGSAEMELRSKAFGLGLKNCIFTGFVSDIHRIENIMDLQINASYGTEATSLALLEGMSLGKPAVVSDFGGNPHVISHGENGLVFQRKSAAALAGAILNIYNDRELYAALSAKAAEAYERRFTAKAMAENIDKLYRALAERG